MVKTIFSKKDFRADWRKSPVMKKILGKSRGILDSPKESRQFYEKLKEHEDGGITKDEMRETLGTLYTDASDSISKSEVSTIGRDWIGSGKRYIFPHKQKNKVIIDEKKIPEKKPTASIQKKTKNATRNPIASNKNAGIINDSNRHKIFQNEPSRISADKNEMISLHSKEPKKSALDLLSKIKGN